MEKKKEKKKEIIMKGFVLASIWTIIILSILYLTHNMWSFGINEIVTHAGGDQFTILLAQTTFVVLVFAVIGAIWFYRGVRESLYQW